ncbi:hypothetical protein PHMEG_00035110, partial [Phytophthora megakarya]
MKINNDAESRQDLYTELQQTADLFIGSKIGNKKQQRQREELQVLTQNLQGFVSERRAGWLRGWKQHTGERPADVIYVQDTHLKTEKDIEEVTAMWNRVWGVKDPTHPLSYWTKMGGGSGGVGILLQPSIAAHASPWRKMEWTSERIAVSFRGWTMINIYAPVEKTVQKEFYRDLQKWSNAAQPIILGGDFNAVLQPAIDRITQGLPSTKSCESAELDELVDRLDLIDAVHLTTHADDDSVPDPLTHYSFWRNNSASRLDRFYLTQAWDTFARQIALMLRDIARMDKERTTVYYNNLRASLNRQAETRADLQRIANQCRVRQGQMAFGRTLQPTTENVKRFYKRHADWQRDQTVTEILPSPGHFYPDSIPLAEKMASEWNGIMGGTHASMD